MKKTRKKRRWLRRILWVFLGLFILLFGFVGWAYLFCFAEPPDLDYEPAILRAAAPAERDGRVHYGGNWFERRPGRSMLYLQGDPYSIGYANARLTERYLALQETDLIEKVREFFPGTLEFLAIATIVLVNNRNLPDYVPREYQEEILGLAEGSEDPFPKYGPRYHRLLNYHAAHDIGHWVWDKPVMGCSAFAARGPATRTKTLLVGRNFDFEAGRTFDENKIIGCYRPARGHAFLSVAWPGMAGAVTGLNEKKIFCSINGAHSEDKDNIGTPVSIVVRQVLQYASTLDEAIERIAQAKVFVSDSYLVADGKSGEAAIVEKSPARVEVRRMGDDGLLLQANHFECAGLSDDEGNLEYMKVGTSLKRRARLAELVRGEAGNLDAAVAARILRDRKAAGGEDLALGNRGAINAVIATHSVIADVTRGILWVSRGPHQLGEYDAYAIQDFGTPPAPSIPASVLLSDGRYEKLGKARELIRKGGIRNLERALALNPGDPEALHALGAALEKHGREAEALARYEEALAAHPPYGPLREELEAAIGRLR